MCCIFLCCLFLCVAIHYDRSSECNNSKYYDVCKYALVCFCAGLVVQLITDEQAHEYIGSVADNADNTGNSRGELERNTDFSLQRPLGSVEAIDTDSCKDDQAYANSDIGYVAGNDNKCDTNDDLCNEDADKSARVALFLVIVEAKDRSGN